MIMQLLNKKKKMSKIRVDILFNDDTKRKYLSQILLSLNITKQPNS